MNIPVTRTPSPKPRPQPNDLGFGRFFTDHVFSMEHDKGRGWHDARIGPYSNLTLDPAAGVVQYAQSIFEGLKAFRTPSGIALFRPDKHVARMNMSARRLCMPEIDPALLLESIREAVRVDAEWVPSAPGTALYVRPTMFASEAFLGVRPSARYHYVVLMSPVGAYFQGEARPLRLWVEKEFVRAARGGIGAAKAGANYAASLLAAERAKAHGFDQVLWLDSAEKRYVEEIGTMNVFVRIGDTLITPSLDSGSILPGVTRDAVLVLLREWGVKVEERELAFEELVAAHRAGTLKEAFGTGTAAVVSPIGELAWDGGDPLKLPSTEVAKRLKVAIEDIQYGRADDPRGWRHAL